ncbi:protein HEADING DATE REPRESSOR 1-like [Neltuma alba]|uniref:protein HEADING DATE REPRESSOR 1-like n=1 Tax=Neltuma alba TaxID=207710 RepID=UPI0010A38A87|nr:protein HEADING DATE REPRESSOR 1-like [Prosopis alba]XP_028793933.1 protein HEADING DATE REPRESSOR 1-like [Prosopis alba]
MEIRDGERMTAADAALNGFSPVTSTRIGWKSRRRSASGKNLEVSNDTASANKPPSKQEEPPPAEEMMQDSTAVPFPELSERRKALFEPLEPIKNINGRRPSAESLLPPPDFESANYPKGWLIGKKRKLVNVDVVESMRRIAIQEMNRKDREIDGLNEQLEEDARCLEHLQVQLLEEKSKRARIERENAMLQEQVNMLMNMIQENEQMADEEPGHDES